MSPLLSLIWALTSCLVGSLIWSLLWTTLKNSFAFKKQAVELHPGPASLWGTLRVHGLPAGALPASDIALAQWSITSLERSHSEEDSWRDGPKSNGALAADCELLLPAGRIRLDCRHFEILEAGDIPAALADVAIERHKRDHETVAKKHPTIERSYKVRGAYVRNDAEVLVQGEVMEILGLQTDTKATCWQIGGSPEHPLRIYSGEREAVRHSHFTSFLLVGLAGGICWLQGLMLLWALVAYWNLGELMP